MQMTHSSTAVGGIATDGAQMTHASTAGGMATEVADPGTAGGMAPAVADPGKSALAVTRPGKAWRGFACQKHFCNSWEHGRHATQTQTSKA